MPVLRLSTVCGTTRILGRIIHHASLVCTPRVGPRDAICLGPRGLRLAKSFGIHNTCCGVSRLSSRRGTENIVTYSTNGRTRKITLTTAGYNVGSLVYLPRKTPVSGIRTAGRCKTRIYLIPKICSSTCRGTLRLHSRGKCAFIRPFSSRGIVTKRNAVNLRLLRRVPSIRMIVIPVNKKKLVSKITCTLGTLGPSIGMCNMRTLNTTDVTGSVLRSHVRHLRSISAFTSKVTIGRPKAGAFSLMGRCISKIMAIARSRVTTTVLTLVRHRQVITRKTKTISITTTVFGGMPMGNGGTIYLISKNGVSIAVLDHIVDHNVTGSKHACTMALSLVSGPKRLLKIDGVITRRKKGMVSMRRRQGDRDTSIAKYTLHIIVRAEGRRRVTSVHRGLLSTNCIVVGWVVCLADEGRRGWVFLPFLTSGFGFSARGVSFCDRGVVLCFLRSGWDHAFITILWYEIYGGSQCGRAS